MTIQLESKKIDLTDFGQAGMQQILGQTYHLLLRKVNYKTDVICIAKCHSLKINLRNGGEGSHASNTKDKLLKINGG